MLKLRVYRNAQTLGLMPRTDCLSPPGHVHISSNKLCMLLTSFLRLSRFSILLPKKTNPALI